MIADGSINTAATTTLRTATNNGEFVVLRITNKADATVSVDVLVNDREWFPGLFFQNVGTNQNTAEIDIMLDTGDTLKMVTTGTPEIDWFLHGKIAP